MEDGGKMNDEGFREIKVGLRQEMLVLIKMSRAGRGEELNIIREEFKRNGAQKVEPPDGSVHLPSSPPPGQEHQSERV